MKKFFILTAMMIMAFVCAKAQDIQLVTVQHGSEMQAFYGPDGFKNAMAAAQKGDVISLSGGNFNSATIDKAVTIQGAGYVQDVKNNRYKTLFIGDVNINLPEGESGLYIEGICTYNNFNIQGNVASMSIVRCLMTNNVEVKSESNNLTFLHCRINNLKLTGVSHSALVRNCAIENFGGSKSNAEDGVAENCVFCNSFDYDNVIHFTFKNCFILCYLDNLKSASNSFYYNIGSYDYTFNWNTLQEGNTFERRSNINAKYFGDNNANYQSALTLTEEGKKIKGQDGTEVGIHGGSMPFTDVPSTPQITQKTVAPQSDANGKLAVKFVIEAQK
ncbi:MAG: hypothetical protein MJZ08_01305 [Bacteroidaceae bacterium]|nr:hypothetical protein [Bacteroidaceae bacterium]